MIYQYMDSKAQEYVVFDPARAKRLFLLLRPYLCLNSYNIHIIGTNGKGSTGRFITQSIIESKYKVLHFTSPHVFDFRERFYTNNGIVDIQTLINAHNFLQQFSFIQEASYFEYATFLALVLGQDCEYLVMEAGVGGEFDSTSVLHYDITIFTRIGLDHKEILGSTLETIALTKLRAAQGNIFTHFQEKKVLNLIEKIKNINIQKQELGLKYNPVQNITYLCENDLHAEEVKTYNNTHKIPHFLLENLGLAFLVLKKINIPLLKGKLDIVGRFQTVSENVVVDVGHNVMAAKAALNAAKLHFNNTPFVLIYNSYKDKEIIDILNTFKENITEIIIFIVENRRIIDFNEMKNILDSMSITYSFFSPYKMKLDSLSIKLIKSKELLQHDKKYLVFGSFSLVEQFLLWFNKNHEKQSQWEQLG